MVDGKMSPLRMRVKARLKIREESTFEASIQKIYKSILAM